ncbi:GIY-YIG nuclease family protein [Candidatus Woesearchaeota archaeon]|nr:GIY-YIG nuclease family protein [Candidatus Woesearchaeota archaeon]
MPQYVYVLQNLAKDRIYIGCTDNLDRRLAQHNQGESIYTKDKGLFRIIWYCCFDDEKQAFLFEKYLKGGSDRAFIRKQILP